MWKNTSLFLDLLNVLYLVRNLANFVHLFSFWSMSWPSNLPHPLVRFTHFMGGTLCFLLWPFWYVGMCHFVFLPYLLILKMRENQRLPLKNLVKFCSINRFSGIMCLGWLSGNKIPTWTEAKHFFPNNVGMVCQYIYVVTMMIGN